MNQVHFLNESWDPQSIGSHTDSRCSSVAQTASEMERLLTLDKCLACWKELVKFCANHPDL